MSSQRETNQDRDRRMTGALMRRAPFAQQAPKEKQSTPRKVSIEAGFGSPRDAEQHGISEALSMPQGAKGWNEFKSGSVWSGHAGYASWPDIRGGTNSGDTGAASESLEDEFLFQQVLGASVGGRASGMPEQYDLLTNGAETLRGVDAKLGSQQPHLSSQAQVQPPAQAQMSALRNVSAKSSAGMIDLGLGSTGHQDVRGAQDPLHVKSVLTAAENDLEKKITNQGGFVGAVAGFLTAPYRAGMAVRGAANRAGLTTARGLGRSGECEGAMDYHQPDSAANLTQRELYDELMRLQQQYEDEYVSHQMPASVLGGDAASSQVLYDLYGDSDAPGTQAVAANQGIFDRITAAVMGIQPTALAAPAPEIGVPQISPAPSASPATAPAASSFASAEGMNRFGTPSGNDVLFKMNTRRGKAHAATRGLTGSAAGARTTSGNVYGVGRNSGTTGAMA